MGALSEDAGLDQELLFEDDMRLILPASHRWAKRDEVTLDDLQQEPFIIRESGSGTLKSIQMSFEQKGLSIRKLNVVSEIGSTEAVLQAIKAEAGISISPIAFEFPSFGVNLRPFLGRKGLRI